MMKFGKEEVFNRRVEEFHQIKIAREVEGIYAAA